MKPRRIFTIALVTLGLVAVLTTGALAQATWYWNVRIDAVGGFSDGSWNNCVVALTNMDNPTGYTTKWFLLHPDYSNQMLATALTAKANGDPVWANLDFDSEYSYVYGILLAGE